MKLASNLLRVGAIDQFQSNKTTNSIVSQVSPSPIACKEGLKRFHPFSSSGHDHQPNDPFKAIKFTQIANPFCLQNLESLAGLMRHAILLSSENALFMCNRTLPPLQFFSGPSPPVIFWIFFEETKAPFRRLNGCISSFYRLLDESECRHSKTVRTDWYASCICFNPSED